MLKDMTRTGLVQIWFATVAVTMAAGIAFGATATIERGAILVGVSLVPLFVVLMLWPRVQPPTIADVLHGADRRR